MKKTIILSHVFYYQPAVIFIRIKIFINLGQIIIQKLSESKPFMRPMEYLNLKQIIHMTFLPASQKQILKSHCFLQEVLLNP